MQTKGDNPNPTIYQVAHIERAQVETREGEEDAFDALEIFDHLRNITDPEHPVVTLEQLNVVKLDQIEVDNAEERVTVWFTPTIPHCSMATLIGLCLRVKLLRSIPDRFKVDIMVSPGSHASEGSVNRQLNDKERVAAALENDSLLNVVNNCIAHTE
uniref:MIP18 family-like domain-containing protein n=1 Tax=Arcella intermedia TaxID=1963864 RepID=A0A6B2LN96_9EUKA